MKSIIIGVALVSISALASPEPAAVLEITLKVSPANRPAAAAVHQKYKRPFLEQAKGAQTKLLLLRDGDV